MCTRQGAMVMGQIGPESSRLTSRPRLPACPHLYRSSRDGIFQLTVWSIYRILIASVYLVPAGRYSPPISLIWKPLAASGHIPFYFCKIVHIRISAISTGSHLYSDVPLYCSAYEAPKVFKDESNSAVTLSVSLYGPIEPAGSILSSVMVAGLISSPI